MRKNKFVARSPILPALFSTLGLPVNITATNPIRSKGKKRRNGICPKHNIKYKRCPCGGSKK